MTKRRPADTAVTFETIHKIALALDNVEESTSYGTLAFKVGGALLARLHQDGCSLVVRMGFEDREELMATHVGIVGRTPSSARDPLVAPASE